MKWKIVSLIVSCVLFIVATIETVYANDPVVAPEILEKIPKHLHDLLNTAIPGPLTFEELPSGVYWVIIVRKDDIALLMRTENNIIYPVSNLPKELHTPETEVLKK